MRWIEMFDLLDLASAGWGVVFHRDADPAVEEALSPLLDHRREAAGDLYRRMTYLPGETKDDFLLRNGIGPGPVNPRCVPYYLLIVGGPLDLPFHVQFQLDVGYAVGRLCLQVRHQGGLMCADWPGPAAWQGPVPPDFYFSADDLGDAFDAAGLLAFFYGCYSAGTPKIGNFSTPDRPLQVASTDFIAELPQRLLGYPRGGALAVIGSVDRTHDDTFLWEARVQVRIFELILRHLMRGDPVGLAMEHLNRCAAELASDLLTAGYEHGLEIENEEELHSRLWQAYQDARGYIILGDPATRLNVAIN